MAQNEMQTIAPWFAGMEPTIENRLVNAELVYVIVYQRDVSVVGGDEGMTATQRLVIRIDAITGDTIVATETY